MAAPLSMRSGAIPLSPSPRGIFRLRFLRRLLGAPEETPERASAACPPVRLGPGTFDWDGPDTSRTQAELELLK